MSVSATAFVQSSFSFKIYLMALNRATFLLLIGALLVFTIGNVYLLSERKGQIEGYQSVIRTESALITEARGIQVLFKKQVQEWKNVLLRSRGPADHQKYLTSFLKYESQVQQRSQSLSARLTGYPSVKDVVDSFLLEHQVLAERYGKALATLSSDGPFAADRLVRGIDRAPTDIFDGVCDKLEEKREETIQFLSKQGNSLEILSLMFQLAVSLLLVAVVLLLVRLRSLNATEQRRAKELMMHHEKLAQLGQMIAEIGHDLNSPINVVLGSQGSIRDGAGELKSLLDPLFDESDESKAFQSVLASKLGTIESSTDNIQVAGERLHELSLALRNQTRFDTKMDGTVDVAQVIHESLVLAGPRLKLHQTEVSLGNLPPVECHRTGLGQVITNLLLNCSDALEEAPHISSGDVRGLISIRSDLSYAESKPGVSIEISDNGLGVPSAIRDRIFKPFFTTKEVGKGTGLGLAICREFAERHQGFMQVEDDAKLGGAKFTVWLPLTQ